MSLYFEVFNPLKKWKKGQFPLSPQVSIRLAAYRNESNGSLTFGPYMATEAEIDHTIDSMIKELEKLRKAAKKELKATIKMVTSESD
jgi:hypothetical protein